VTGQLDMALGAEDFGENGKRAWFWQDGAWCVGRAWAITEHGKVGGMCRDYGPWGIPYAVLSPMETHGMWPLAEVRFKKPAEQYVGPYTATLPESEAA
jgi:hypothetical protein